MYVFPVNNLSSNHRQATVIGQQSKMNWTLTTDINMLNDQKHLKIELIISDSIALFVMITHVDCTSKSVCECCVENISKFHIKKAPR